MLARLGHSLSRVKIWGAAPPKGRNIVFRKRRFRWVQFYLEISKVTEFNGFVLPNAGGIVVNQVLDRFQISLSVPEIFAAEL